MYYFQYYQSLVLFYFWKTNHTGYSNQSKHETCLFSLHQLIIPVWIIFQKYVANIISWGVSQAVYRNMNNMNRIVTEYISLHPYQSPIYIYIYMYICIGLQLAYQCHCACSWPCSRYSAHWKFVHVILPVSLTVTHSIYLSWPDDITQDIIKV